MGDGHLLDYDVVKVRSEVRVSGVFLREGDRVEQVDPETGRKRLETLEDASAVICREIVSVYLSLLLTL